MFQHRGELLGSSGLSLKFGKNPNNHNVLNQRDDTAANWKICHCQEEENTHRSLITYFVSAEEMISRHTFNSFKTTFSMPHMFKMFGIFSFVYQLISVK